MPHILIVDDQPEIRLLLKVTLCKHFTVLEAHDGASALESIRQQAPQIVLLDVMMPGGMDGLQVLDAIKSNPQTKEIVVAMVSARGQISDQEEAKRRGADAYFVKPFSPLQLVAWARSKVT